MAGLTPTEQKLEALMVSIAQKKGATQNKTAANTQGTKKKARLHVGQKLLLITIFLTGVILFDAAIMFGLIDITEGDAGWYVHKLMDWIYDNGAKALQ